ncbi:MAG: acyl-CoA dehydrogenase family protein, partial [Acidimicrobiaceae bacterium]|nr:acyl-CoA dehydrogenase family protein [Acidimicrobiaceae bacterium]
MDLNFTDDQQALRDSFAGLFADVAGVDVVRAAEPLGYDEKVWDQLIRTGAPTMAVPEDRGGGGAGSLEVVIVAQEFGRRLAPAPLIESIVACSLLARAGAPEPIMHGVVDGSILPTVALVPVHAGTARLVPGGAVADLVVALDGDQLVVLRRRSGSRPHSPAPDNLGCSPIADWSLSDPSVDRLVLVDGVRAEA